MLLVDLEKAFDRVPQKVIWWAMRKLGVEEWIVQLVQGMYLNARSRVSVGEGFSQEFEVKVGVHQGSVFSPFLFIIVLEALSREFRAGVPWEDGNHEEEGVESKCRKDKGHDLWYRPGPLAEFR